MSLIVLNYNNGGMTADCLASILPALVRNPCLSVVVVDNASDDNSSQHIQAWMVEHMSELGSRAVFVQSSLNQGYGTGNNLGIRSAPGEPKWFWILNNDTTVSTRSMENVLDATLRTDADVLGTRVHEIGTPSEHDIIGGGWLRAYQGRTVMARAQDWSTDRTPTLDFISGSSLIVKADTLRAVGLFPEEHFLFWEEMDICRRIREFGGSMQVVEGATVNHHGGATSGASRVRKTPSARYYSTRSAILFYRKHLPTLRLIPLVVSRTAHAVATTITGDVLGGRAIIEGIKAGLVDPLQAAPRWV